MATLVMMVSVERVVQMTSISQNLDTHTIRPNIFIAQEQVRQILGDLQYSELIQKIGDGDALTQNETYLMDYIQPFLIWLSALETTVSMYMKMVNNGVTTGTDGDGRKGVSIEELKFLRSMLTNRSETYRKQLQEYIRINLGLYPLIAQSNSNQVVRSKRRANYFSGIHFDDYSYRSVYFPGADRYSELAHTDPPGCDI
jgi:hypothetical protein